MTLTSKVNTKKEKKIVTYPDAQLSCFTEKTVLTKLKAQTDEEGSQLVKVLVTLLL